MDMLNREVTYVYEIKYSKESTNKKNRCLVKSRIKPKDICDYYTFNINIRVLFHSQI